MAFRCSCPPATNLTHTLNRIACVFCLTCTVGITNADAQTALTRAPQVANGTVFIASVKKTLHADKLKPGDKVDFDSEEATLVGGRVVVPAKAVFHGQVVQSVAAKQDPQQVSHLSILVDSVTWKNKSLPVCASIAGFGFRQFNVRPEQPPMPTTMNTPEVNSDSVRKQAVTQNRTGVDLSDRSFGLLQALPDAFTYPESSVTIYGEGFVTGISIHRSPTAASVLSRKNKNVDLPGGLLVALQQLQVAENGCPTQSVP